MKFLSIVAMMFVTFFFAGCSDDLNSTALENLPIIESSNQNRDEKIPVDVLWDATISMQGFTTIAPMNVYRTLPDEIENICALIGDVNFYRFGSDAMKIDRAGYRKFTEPETYTELVTSMANAVEISNPEHLSIVVTDLFESESDWSLVTQRLKDKFFTKHLSTAIIGIRNPFDGKIFDVGLKAQSFSYATGGDQNRFRPFYLFVLGREDVVKDFVNRFEKFRRQQVIQNEIEYVIFTEHLTDHAETFATLPILDSQNLFESVELEDNRVREFGIDSPTDPASVTFNFKYKPTLGTCSIDRNSLQTQIDFFTLDSESDSWIETRNARSDGKFSLERDEESESYLLKFEFTPERNLQIDRWNFLHASLKPPASSFELPEWISQWNMGNIDVNPAAFDGTKTTNLLHIAQSLLDAQFESSQPSLVDLYFLIEN